MLVVVVDANTVFSALLSKGRTFDVFLANNIFERFEFIAPEFLFFELGKNFDEIVSRSKLSPEELAEVFKIIKGEIDFIPFEEFNRYAEEADKIAPHARDVQYFALALSFNAAIWSNEKAFKKQSRVKVFSTSELISFLSEI